jgi:histidinol-phosphate/aromatic aminotransferase/cobyric acid decarboxylase-like protein
MCVWPRRLTVSMPSVPNPARRRVREILAASAKEGLIYVCNPNNPTGSITPNDDLVSSSPRLRTTRRFSWTKPTFTMRRTHPVAGELHHDRHKTPGRVIQALKQRNVHVGRLFSAFPNYMRVTIGKKVEMETFVSAFGQAMA